MKRHTFHSRRVDKTKPEQVKKAHDDLAAYVALHPTFTLTNQFWLADVQELDSKARLAASFTEL